MRAVDKHKAMHQEHASLGAHLHSRSKADASMSIFKIASPMVALRGSADCIDNEDKSGFSDMRRMSTSVGTRICFTGWSASLYNASISYPEERMRLTKSKSKSVGDIRFVFWGREGWWKASEETRINEDLEERKKTHMACGDLYNRQTRFYIKEGQGSDRTIAVIRKPRFRDVVISCVISGDSPVLVRAIR